MSMIVGLIVRGAGLFGFSLSPFMAGAIMAGVLAAAFGVYSAKVYFAGYHSAEAKCEAAALRAKIAAMKADLDAAQAAAKDADARADAIRAEAETTKELTNAYIAELAKRPNGACALNDADLRWLSNNGKRPGRPPASGGARRPDGPR